MAIEDTQAECLFVHHPAAAASANFRAVCSSPLIAPDGRVLGHPYEIAALNNLADAIGQQGCRAQALAIVDRGLATAAKADPLRAVLEQTRREILAAVAAGAGEPAACAHVEE